MPAFWLCTGVLLVIIVFIASPHFSSIGRFIRRLGGNTTDDENTNKEKEK